MSRCVATGSGLGLCFELGVLIVIEEDCGKAKVEGCSESVHHFLAQLNTETRQQKLHENSQMWMRSELWRHICVETSSVCDTYIVVQRLKLVWLLCHFCHPQNHYFVTLSNFHAHVISQILRSHHFGSEVNAHE